MGEHSSAGTSFLIGTTAANPLTDTYVEIGQITNYGEFGTTYAEVKHTPVKGRGVKKHKGSRDDGSLVLQLARDPDDAGQAAARAALASDYNYNFKLVFNDAGPNVGDTPSALYFKAKVMAFPTNVGGADGVVARTLTLALDTDSMVEVPAAPAD